MIGHFHDGRQSTSSFATYGTHEKYSLFQQIWLPLLQHDPLCLLLKHLEEIQGGRSTTSGLTNILSANVFGMMYAKTEHTI